MSSWQYREVRLQKGVCNCTKRFIRGWINKNPFSQIGSAAVDVDESMMRQTEKQGLHRYDGNLLNLCGF